jgi:hypothetical protein
MTKVTGGDSKSFRTVGRAVKVLVERGVVGVTQKLRRAQLS